MKTMKITENTIERINKVTDELIGEARGIISNIAKPENEMTISKEESNAIIKDAMEAIDKLIRDYNLTNAKVNVWNGNESNPAMEDKEFIEVLHGYYKDTYFNIKKKTRCDQLINRIYRLVDEVKVLISNANRIAEMEGVEDTNESTRYEENQEVTNMKAKEIKTNIYRIHIEETNDIIEIHEEFRDDEVHYYIAQEDGAYRKFAFGITLESYNNEELGEIDLIIDYIINEYYEEFIEEIEAIEEYYMNKIYEMKKEEMNMENLKINKEAFLVRGDVMSGNYTAYFRTNKSGTVIAREYRDFEIYIETEIEEESM